MSMQLHLERALHVGERALALQKCGAAGRAAAAGEVAGGGNACADGRRGRAAAGEGVA